MEQVRGTVRRSPATRAGRVPASRPAALLITVLATILVGCGSSEEPVAEPRATSSASPSTSSPTSDPAASPTSSPTSSPRTSPTSAPAEARPRRGVDVSHHQGPVDWSRVKADGIGFAYLKATEGSTFVDPRFAGNARQARRAGLRVGGYHYFTLCSPGAPQAAHFVKTLDAAPADTMPPAVDLELGGNCADPPPREELLGEVRAFVTEVERRTGQRVVVYAYPDFESRFEIAAALDRRLWVRRIGSTPPEGDWWLWQRDDRASIDGIAGPADLNVLAR